MALRLQRLAGNQAVTRLLQSATGAVAVQRRPDTDAYHTDKWKPSTYQTYMPPGSPVRGDLAGMNEEVEDAWKAGLKQQQQWRVLADAWVQHIFATSFGDKGTVKAVYESKEDKDTGGYSFSQKVTGVPLIVIHAHMEKNHQPSTAVGGAAGPVHWKWEALESSDKGFGGPIPLTQYRLLNLDEARSKRNTEVIAPHLTGELRKLVTAVSGSAAVADMILGTIVSRFGSTQSTLIEAYLAKLTGSAVGEVKALLSISASGSTAEDESATSVLIRANLLASLAQGASVSDATAIKKSLATITGQALEELRPVPSKTGTVELRPLLGGLEIPPGNEKLTNPTLAKIRDIFDAVMGSQALYNSANAPMELIEDIRKARKADPTASMTSVFTAFSKSGTEVIDKYQAADCIAMAEKVKVELAKIGVDCYVIGSTGGNFLNEIPDPEQGGRARIRHEAARTYAVFSHASVVVPYRALDGTPKAIHIEAGMGPAPEFYTQYESLFAAEVALAKKKYDLSKPVLDTAELQKKHIRCKWKMWFSNTADQKKKAFIDLAEGTVFVTGETDREFLDAYKGAKINFKEILADPGKTVTITIGKKPLAMSNLDSMTLFLETIATEFKLGKEFVPNMLFLTSNIKEYSENILLGPINAVRVTYDIKNEMIEQRALAEKKGAKVSHGTDMTAADALVEEAAGFVTAGDAGKALAKYTEARDAYTAIVKKI
jgi:hypothetical protein